MIENEEIRRLHDIIEGQKKCIMELTENFYAEKLRADLNLEEFFRQPDQQDKLVKEIGAYKELVNALTTQFREYYIRDSSIQTE